MPEERAGGPAQYATPCGNLIRTNEPSLEGLPTELRLQIYELLWPSVNEVPLQTTQISYIPDSNHGRRAALLQVNRFLRHEAQPTFYKNTIYKVNVHNRLPFIKFLVAIGPNNAALIKDIVFYYKWKGRSKNHTDALDRLKEELKANGMRLRIRGQLSVAGSMLWYPRKAINCGWGQISVIKKSSLRTESASWRSRSARKVTWGAAVRRHMNLRV